MPVIPPGHRRSTGHFIFASRTARRRDQIPGQEQRGQLCKKRPICESRMLRRWGSMRPARSARSGRSLSSILPDIRNDRPVGTENRLLAADWKAFFPILFDAARLCARGATNSPRRFIMEREGGADLPVAGRRHDAAVLLGQNRSKSSQWRFSSS